MTPATSWLLPTRGIMPLPRVRAGCHGLVLETQVRDLAFFASLTIEPAIYHAASSTGCCSTGCCLVSPNHGSGPQLSL